LKLQNIQEKIHKHFYHIQTLKTIQYLQLYKYTVTSTAITHSVAKS